MKRILTLFAAAAVLVGCASETAPAIVGSASVLNSPDGKLELSFGLSSDGTPVYELRREGRDIVLPSTLGYELRGKFEKVNLADKSSKVYGAPMGLHSGFSIVDVTRNSVDETWEPVWGEESRIRNCCNEMVVTLVQGDVEVAENGGGKKWNFSTYENNAKNILMTLRFRLYDDGLGFRYEFPQQKELTYFTVKEELTQFRMAGDHKALWIPGDYDTQEYSYTESRLSEVPELMDQAADFNASQMLSSPSGVQTPVQMKTDDGLYINIHEAQVVNYPTTNLDVDVKTNTLTTRLTPDAEGWKGRLQTPCRSPWRTVMVVDDAREVLESRLILNLNDPCAIEDVSWIHPTKYMGVWWEMITGKSSWSYTDDFPAVELGVSDYSKARPHGRHGANNANVRRYIDFAAENGFDGLLIEGWNEGWEDWYGCQKESVFDFVTPYPDFDIAALNEYAHSKGIRLIMHHETSSSTVNYERHIDEAFALMNKYGYDAVKTGYVGDIIPFGEHHYSQPLINHYNYVVNKAAECRIMVNAHEAVRPTGLCRTWPNMIGNESARGTEFKGVVQPKHVTVLPFTRLQGGPMDFTPGIFEMNMGSFVPGSTEVVHSTLCKQLALYVTMYSPLQMAADLPENYAAHMDAFQFIKDVAVDWEQSRYLLAEPGDYIVVARQAKKSTLDKAAKGVAALKDGKKNYVNGATRFCMTDVNGCPASDKDVWFIGGVTDENRREVEFPLDFLKPSSRYEAMIYADAPDADGVNISAEGGTESAERYTIEKRIVDSTTLMKMTMAPSGGFAVSLKEI